MKTASASGDEGARPPTTAVVVQPVGLAAPLGYLGVTIGAVVLAAFHLRLLDANQQTSVAVALLAFVAPLQAFAAVSAFRSRDTQIGTEFGLLAGVWTTLGIEMIRLPVPGTSPALGVVLTTAGVAFISALLPAARTRLGPAGLMALGAVHIAIVGVYHVTAGDGVRIAAGVVGMVLAAGALYTAVAFQLEEATGRTVLWLGRSGAAAEAVEGSFEQQLEEVAHSPGVRKRI